MTNQKDKKNHKATAADTKQKIFEAAEILFTKHGIENVSVESITKKAGVAKGSFYLHFDSKKALITEMIAAIVSDVDIDYQHFFESVPKEASASDLLYDTVDKVINVLVEYLGYKHLRILYDALLDERVDASSAIAPTRQLNRIFETIIAMGIQSGEFDPAIEPPLLATHLMLALRGLTYEWCIRYPDMDLRETAHIHIKLLVNGIRNC
jgi:AcrR family transcriptional regulator